MLGHFSIVTTNKKLIVPTPLCQKGLFMFFSVLAVAITRGNCTGRAERESLQKRGRLGTSSDCFVYDDSYAQTSMGGGYDLTLCHKTTVHYVWDVTGSGHYTPELDGSKNHKTRNSLYIHTNYNFPVFHSKL